MLADMDTCDDVREAMGPLDSMWITHDLAHGSQSI